MSQVEIKYKVCVRSFTYNQSGFILDTLDGFASQKTNFSFVVTLVDDSSTDGEQEIILKHLNKNFAVGDNIVAYEKDTDSSKIIYAQHRTNKNYFIALILLKYNHYQAKKSKMPYIEEWRLFSKYEAVCEGDDYWINEHKLQIQVDYMDSHPDCVLCYTDFIVVNQDKKHTNNRYTPIVCYSGDVYEKLLKTNFVQTATILCRVSAITNAFELCRQRKTKYDYGLFLELSLMGLFGYIPVKTAAYRICEESYSHSTSIKKEIKFGLELLYIKRIYHNLKHSPENKIKKILSEIMLVLKIIIKHYLRDILKFKH